MDRDTFTTTYRDTQGFQDRLIPCAHCQEQFIWTAGEQAFYAEKGFTNPPRTCRGQRQVRKQQREHGFSNGRTDHHPDTCPHGESAGSEGGGRTYDQGSRGFGGDRGFAGRREYRPRQQPAVTVASGNELRGTVLRVLRDRDFGFLKDADGVEYYFHRSSAYDFNDLYEGATVDFVTESSPRGPRAVRVELAN